MVRKVRFGSALLATARARIASPEPRATPTARPFSTRILVTSARVRMIAPRARAAPASASEIVPMPPCTCPMYPWDSSSPPDMLWNMRPDAEQGVIGPLWAPRTLEQPIRFFTSADLNRASTRSMTLAVRKSINRPASSSFNRRISRNGEPPYAYSVLRYGASARPSERCWVAP